MRRVFAPFKPTPETPDLEKREMQEGSPDWLGGGWVPIA